MKRNRLADAVKAATPRPPTAAERAVVRSVEAKTEADRNLLLYGVPVLRTVVRKRAGLGWTTELFTRDVLKNLPRVDP